MSDVEGLSGTAYVDELMQQEAERKEQMRLARAHSFGQAWNMSRNVFDHLKVSGLTVSTFSHTVGHKRGIGRTIRLVTPTPWIEKGDGIEIQAVRVQEQELLSRLGQLIMGRQPAEPYTTLFALHTRPAGNNSVMDRHAVIEPGHQPTDRIRYPSLHGMIALQQERYDRWNELDTEVIEDLTRIDDHLVAAAFSQPS